MAILRSSQIVTNGLVFALDAADQGSYISGSNTWYDLSGNSSNGALSGSSTFNAANGGSISFNGTNQNVNISPFQNLQFTQLQAYTIAVWLYWSSTASTGFDYPFCVTLPAGNTNQGSYYLTLDNGSLLTNSFLFDYNDSTVGKSIQGAANSITKNKWLYLVGTYSDNTTTTARFYINGTSVVVTSRLNQSPGPMGYTGMVAVIGGRGSSTTPTFTGSISNIQIYNRALNAVEVLQNYNASKGRFGL